MGINFIFGAKFIFFLLPANLAKPLLSPLKIWSIFVDVSRGERAKNGLKMARKTSLTIFDSYFFSMYRKDKRQS
jgi:hypothetical protein